MGILKGTFPALLTPYHKDKSINEQEFLRLCEFGISRGLDGLFCNGSAGDSQALGLSEQIKLIELSVKVANKKIPVITGITSTIYQNTMILAQKAYELGADALLVVMPYYYKLSEEALFEYAKNLAKSVKLPLYVYNIPLFAPPLSLPFIEKLSKLENIAGIKDSSGDALLLEHILDVVPSGFDVFVGREEFYAGALFAGVKGSMTSTGGVFPEIMSQIYVQMSHQNYLQAIKLQKSLLKIIRFAMSFSFPLGFALLLQARGFDFSQTIHPISKSMQETLEKSLDQAKFLIKELETESGVVL